LAEQTKTSRQARKRKAAKATKSPRKPRHKAGTKITIRQTAGRSTRTSNIRPTGKSVARLRRQLGLSVADFARQLGVTTASVYRWESTTGRLQLQPRSLRALATLRQRADGR
jgi:DNA-binding transcriptional regulator YiaG